MRMTVVDKLNLYLDLIAATDEDDVVEEATAVLAEAGSRWPNVD